MAGDAEIVTVRLEIRVRSSRPETGTAAALAEALQTWIAERAHEGQPVAERGFEVGAITIVDAPADPAAVEALSLWSRANGVTAGELDALVEEAKSEEAAGVNDGGPDAQLDFLLRRHDNDLDRTWRAIRP